VAKEIALSEKQSRCLESKAKSLLLSGGFRSGKTMSALIKIITQHLPVPKNRGLIGRLTYPELRDTVQKDFFDLLPKEWIKSWNESHGELLLDNGTEVLFRHLDSVSEEEMRGLTLGFAFISQVEEIKESVYLALLSRLNLQTVPSRQVIMDCNPLLFWAYKYFKQERDEGRELIEFSMLDNQKNLTEDYLADMLKRPESWKRQFVYGVWDESLLSDRSVIPVEYIQQQRRFVKESARKLEEVMIYDDVIPGHTYQVGVDVSEGVGQDFSAVSCFDLDSGEQVAFWKGQMQPDLLVQRVVPVAKYFNDALVVPEINGIGLAFLSRLKDSYENIYKRKDFDRDSEYEKEVLGWKTTFSTKPLLVDNFIKLLREGVIKIRANDVIAEMATFVYSDDARSRGMGASEGFHDDSIIASMLSVVDLLKNKGQILSKVDVSFDNMMAGGRAGY